MSPASMSRHSSLTSSSIGSSSLHSASASGNGTPVKTMKHYEDSLKSVKKENFNLKMKIFFLEERLANGNGASNKALINTNTELKIQVENLKQDLNEKLNLLLEANEAIEGLEIKVKDQEERHQIEIQALKNAPNKKEPMIKETSRQANSNKNITKSLVSVNDRSTESLVLEVLEELEEFTEREKKFENKYVKTINELKSEAFNTENELAKIKTKMLGYEEEIESLNANIDAKNDFISALKNEILEKKNDSHYFLNQLDNSSAVIRLREQQLAALKCKSRYRKRKNVRTKCVETEVDNFDLVKLLEDEIIFKNQELQEFVAGIKTRDEKIQTMENIWFRSQTNAPNENDREVMLRGRVEDLTDSNKNLNDQVKMQAYERKLLLRKIRMLSDKSLK